MVGSFGSQPHGDRALERHTRPDPRRYESTQRLAFHPPSGHYAPVAGLDHVWGSTLLSMDFDVTERVATLTARVTDDGLVSTLTLRLSGVSHLHVERPDDNSWDYTEITEAHATETATGFVVQLLFWTEPDGLTARCAEYSVEG